MDNEVSNKVDINTLNDKLEDYALLNDLSNYVTTSTFNTATSTLNTSINTKVATTTFNSATSTLNTKISNCITTIGTVDVEATWGGTSETFTFDSSAITIPSGAFTIAVVFKSTGSQHVYCYYCGLSSGKVHFELRRRTDGTGQITGTVHATVIYAKK